MGFISSLFGANDSYNATPAALQTTNYTDALKAAMNNGVVDNTQSNQTATQQGNLVAALTAAMNGKGPNLAGAQFQQANNQNVASGASLIGSQRGISPQLAARQILNNTANAGQNASNGAAQIAMENQLNAENNLGSVLGTERSQDITQAGNAASAQTSRIGALGGLQNNQNNSQIQNTLGTEGINADVAKQNANTNAAIAGGVINGLSGAGASGAVSSLFASKGGLIQKFDDGGPVLMSPEEMSLPGATPAPSPVSSTPSLMSASDIAKALQTPSSNKQNPAKTYTPVNGSAQAGQQGAQEIGQGIGQAMKALAVLAFANSGGKVPGKAKAAGDSLKNDDVPAMLSPGEVVLPRTIVGASSDKQLEFIKAVKEKAKRQTTGDEGYGKVLQAHRNLQDRVARLEKLCGGGMTRAA